MFVIFIISFALLVWAKAEVSNSLASENAPTSYALNVYVVWLEFKE